jgi:hypothetical protein
MKKTVGVVLAVLIVLAAWITPAHASKSYSLKELSMTVEIPDGWTVFTRGMDANDPAFESLGTDKATVDELLQNGNIYLDAVSADTAAEMAVSMAKDPNNIYNLNLLSGAELDSAVQRIVDLLSINFKVAEHSVYKTGQATFVYAYLSGQFNGRTQYLKEYVTIVNGMFIAAALSSAAPVTEAYDKIIKGVADSIVFTEILPKPDVMYTPPKDAVKVELPDLKMNIEMPGGWVVFTRYMKPDDPVFGFMGTDKAAVDKMLGDGNEYLHAVHRDTLAEISVSMTADSDNIFDYNKKTEAELAAEAQAILSNTLKAYPGDEITLTENYKHSQALFLTADWYTPSLNTYQRLYSTIFNGMNINITFLSYGKPATDEQRQILKGVVDSAVFTVTLPGPASNTGVWSVGGAALLGILAYNIYRVSKKRKARNNSNTNGGASTGGAGGDAQQ